MGAGGHDSSDEVFSPVDAGIIFAGARHPADKPIGQRLQGISFLGNIFGEISPPSAQVISDNGSPRVFEKVRDRRLVTDASRQEETSPIWGGRHLSIRVGQQSFKLSGVFFFG